MWDEVNSTYAIGESGRTYLEPLDTMNIIFEQVTIVYCSQKLLTQTLPKTVPYRLISTIKNAPFEDLFCFDESLRAVH